MFQRLDGARARSAPINAAWLAGPSAEAVALFVDLDDPATIAAKARALLTDLGWVEALLAPLIRALHADPWFEPPFRTSRDALRTGTVLIDCPAVSLTATVTSAAALNRLTVAPTVVLPGRVTLTRYVRGGGAVMRQWRADAAGPDFSAGTTSPARELAPRVLKDGELLRQDGRTRGHLIVSAQNDIVALTVTIKPKASPLMREYAVADGAFVRAASADDTASRMEMLLTFLRVSGRADAARVFEGASRHPAFHLRWAAMREWLMLDAAGAHARLAEMGIDDPNAEVRAAASATLPALDHRLRQQCPA
jgi:hypothetical protein